ncbi:pectin lyase fold/virulence factor [Fennellomyces sp. T-0311]|nr:pectin lyase fold/virulence factor [Fennellomyces sp. T-0311]
MKYMRHRLWTLVTLTAVFAGKATAADCTLDKPSGGDDTPQILEALEKCGSGGTITIPSGDYQLLQPINKNGLEDVTINLIGNLVLPTSMEYQKAAGTDNWIWLEGSGVTLKGDPEGDGSRIIGSGQGWYDSKELDDRFALLGIRLEDSVISSIKLEQPCNNFFNVRNCVNVNFTDLTLTAESDTENPPKNTDGFDLHDSTQLYFSNVDIYNQDDCIAFKNGLIFYPAGSSGYVKNFFATDFTVNNVRLPIWIHSHYPCNPDEYTDDGGCEGYPGPSLIEVSNIRFSGFKGTTTGSYDNNVVIFDCPEGTPCKDLYAENIDVSPPSGAPTYVCNNIDDSKDIGIGCEITSGPLPVW